MFESYQDIFNQRGFDYHQGMLQYPQARKEEFRKIIQLATIQEGNLIADIPSGGCYLGDFIKQKVKIVSVETSREFARDAQQLENNTILVCENISHIPFPQESFDRIISLAGLHHINDKFSFYREVYRLIKPHGLFCLADAFENSKVAKFLNIFVDRYNSRGHQGKFFNHQTLEELEKAQMQVLYAASISYFWQFNSPQDMAKYCQLLFGLDLANQSQIIAGINNYLGYQIKNEKCYMNWELYFIKCIKQ